MPYILLLAGLLVTGFFVPGKSQRGPCIADDLVDAPAPVRRAAKRQGLQAGRDTAIVTSIASRELCITALAHAFAQMDETAPTPQNALHRALTKHLRLPETAADDPVIIAPWIVAETDGSSPAFDTLTRQLKRFDHGTAFDTLMRVLGDVGAARRKGMPSARQAEALGAPARIFRTA